MSGATAKTDGDEPRAGEGPLMTAGAALAVVLVGVFAFLALIVLFAWAPELETGDDGGAHALSRSAVGFAGIVEALKLEQVPVLVSRTRLPKRRDQGLLVATPRFQADDKAVEGLGFAGPTLIVLPKWLAGANPLHHGWVLRLGPMDSRMALSEKLAARLTLLRRGGTIAPVLRLADPAEGTSGALGASPLVAGPVEALQSIKGPGLVPVLTDQAGEVILAREAKTQVYVLSDPDLIDNHGLRDLRTLGSALSLVGGLRAGDGPVIFDVTLDGLARDRSLLRLFFAPPLLGVTLCLAAAAALAGFQAFCRFGPVRREARAIAAGKEAMVDNAALLIRTADRQDPMAARYARLTAEMTARQLGVPRTLGGEAQGALLDRLAERRGLADSYTLLAAVARAARGPESVRSIAARLHRWRLDMTQ